MTSDIQQDGGAAPALTPVQPLPAAIDGRKVGLMICGHGSRDERACAEFRTLCEAMRRRWPDTPVEYGFLEFATPIIRDGLNSLRQAGCRHILAVPGMLFAAGHAKNDIPSVLNRYQAEHPDMVIRYGRELAVDPAMLRAAGDRVRGALRDSPVPARDTLLAVVGRGSSDPDANSNVAKISRLLWEGLGIGWTETCYSGVTFPLVEPGLEHCARLGYRRILVFPYFLFTGVLVDRIYRAVDSVAARHPDIEFVKVPYLNDHPGVLETLAARVREILDGANLMNCQLCKYRIQILGFEASVGEPQESHHHHVEGIGSGGHGHDHGHGHPHGHGHDHHHHGHDHVHHHHRPHPHADHPLGPVTLKQDGQG